MEMINRPALRLIGSLVLLLLTFSGHIMAVTGISSESDAAGNWLVKLSPNEDPVKVAERIGAVYAGSLRGVDGYHRFRFAQQLQSRSDEEAFKITVSRQLEDQPEVLAFEEDVLQVRYPRQYVPADPLFPDQWHLENDGQSGGTAFADARVRPAWDSGLSGAGTVIGIVDEGIQFRHPDLLPNWLVGFGYDYNDEDSDPSPSDDEDRHGTAVAGISMAASNSIGGLGIAYNAQLVPLRLIAGPFRIGQEAEALSYQRDVVDIYNNSWGPSDDEGVQFSDSSQVLKSALANNVSFGRGGLGNIYVWAAGNGGLNGDNSNYDGYNSLPYTISVGAIGHDDIKAGYSEPGANLLVVAPSGGRGAGILTTDNTGNSGYQEGNYYYNFSGTSAAAPMVSGVVALLLEQRPDLGWRDVQQILATTASPVDFSEENWARNAAGHWVSHDYGFGRVDAEAATRLAENWPVLGAMRRITRSYRGSLPQFIAGTVSQSVEVATEIRIQHVLLNVTINHSDWGDLRIELISPEGTSSVLSEPHANANSVGQPGTWTFLSTRCLGESSLGEWNLRISDEGSGGSGTLSSWSVEILGTSPGEAVNQPPEFEDLFIESNTYPIEVDALSGVVDPDGDPLEVISTQMPRVSKLEDLGDGQFSFSMGETKYGTDMFSVLISDGKGAARRRLVHILDPRPVGQNDLYPVHTDFSGQLPVLSNDFDPDGDPLRLVGLSGSFRGEASVGEDNTINYIPPPGFSGVERIQYFLTDDSDGESSGWATVVVQEEAEIALEFDGEDDFIRFNEAPALQMADRFTVEAWIYPTSYGEYVTGFGRIYDRNTFVFFLNGFDHMFYNDQSLVAYFVLQSGQGVAANTGKNTIRLNTWQHVALSYDSTDAFSPVKIYIDGRQVSLVYPLEKTSAPRQPIGSNSQFPLYIGESDSRARAFEGRMSEFRIWNNVLTSQYIADKHDQRLTGNEPGLSLYLPLDQTLDPVAVNIGGIHGALEIFEARRIPLELPWEELESHYTVLQDSGSGWWHDRTLGWFYGDLYPWIYLPSLAWAYTGHEAGRDDYLLWPLTADWGWLQTTLTWYPWFFRPFKGDWIWYLEGTQDPSWFYSSSLEDWLPGDVAFPTF